MACFDAYAHGTNDLTRVQISGVKSKQVMVLAHENFARSIIAWIVRTNQPVAATLEEIVSNDLRMARERNVDMHDLALGPHALRVRRAAQKGAVVRRPENVQVVHTNTPSDRTSEFADSELLPNCSSVLADMPGGLWQNESDHNRMLQRFLVSSEIDTTGDTSLFRVGEAMQFTNIVTLREEQEMLESTKDGPPVEGVKTAAEEREQARQAVAYAINCTQREQWNAALRREKSSQVKRGMQVSRLQRDLKAEQEEAARLREEVAKKDKPDVDGSPMLVAGVLQAEKEELHRIFTFELEKRKTKLKADSLREEMIRDVERDRVIRNLVEQITDTSSSFQRLQDVALGQAETIDKQADALRMLADRSTVLMADVMYFRASQDKAVKVIAEDPAKVALAAEFVEERKDHVMSVNQVASSMLQEAKSNPAARHPSMKELVKIPRGAKAATLPPLPANFVPAALPAAGTLSVMLSTQEAEQQTQAAVEQVEARYNEKIQVLEERLTQTEEQLAVSIEETLRATEQLQKTAHSPRKHTPQEEHTRDATHLHATPPISPRWTRALAPLKPPPTHHEVPGGNHRRPKLLKSTSHTNLPRRLRSCSGPANCPLHLFGSRGRMIARC